jgi:hypothetical protein
MFSPGLSMLAVEGRSQPTVSLVADYQYTDSQSCQGLWEQQKTLTALYLSKTT